MGLCSGRLGALLGRLGPLLDFLDALLVCFEAIFGASRAVSEARKTEEPIIFQSSKDLEKCHILSVWKASSVSSLGRLRASWGCLGLLAALQARLAALLARQ